MLKKIFIIGAVIALTGCATHQQSNELAGAAIGGVIGKQVGGTPGAILGAGIGSMIGGQQPTQRAPIIERQVIIENNHREPQYRASCRVFLDQLENCDRLVNYHNRRSCRIESESRLNECLYRR